MKICLSRLLRDLSTSGTKQITEDVALKVSCRAVSLKEPGLCTRYSGEDTCRSSSPGRGKLFFSPPKIPDRFWGPPSLLFNGYRGSFPGVKLPMRDVDHLRPSGAKTESEWSCTSTPSICLHGMDRETFSFFWPVYLNGHIQRVCENG